MEDVLDLYEEPYDPQRPVVCFDETSTQLLADSRPPIPVGRGRPRRQDYEYLRAGTRNLFLACEPRRGWRRDNNPSAHRCSDFAHQMAGMRPNPGGSRQPEHPPHGIPDAEARRIVNWSSTTPPSTGVGSTSLSSASWPGPVSKAGTPTRTPCKKTSAHNETETKCGLLPSNGGSLPRTLGPSCIASIPATPDWIEY